MRFLIVAALAACTGHVVVLDSPPDAEGIVEEIDPIYDCNLDHVACDIPVPTCDEGETPSVKGLCYGPCVPTLLCKP